MLTVSTTLDIESSQIYLEDNRHRLEKVQFYEFKQKFISEREEIKLILHVGPNYQIILKIYTFRSNIV